MFVIVAYDISQDKLRKKIHTICRRYGMKVQRSLFEFDFSKSSDVDLLIADIKKIINIFHKKNLDDSITKAIELGITETVRIYIMSERYRQKTIILWKGAPLTNTQSYMIV